MLDNYIKNQTESKLATELANSYSPDPDCASREPTSLCDEFTPQDIAEIVMAGEAWRAACSPEFIEAAATALEIGVAELSVAQLCSAIDDLAVRRGDLRLLAAIVRSIDPTTGLCDN